MKITLPENLESPAAGDGELLGAWVRRRDEAAFRELVERHAGWVEGVARRSLADQETARDVAQQVFILLAQKAGGIRGDHLGPWLHRSAVHLCRNAGRREAVRRRLLPQLTHHMETVKPGESNEQDWSEALPALDAALNELAQPDRTLVVQRFLLKRSWREIGNALGRSEDAARMALAPALEKLSLLLRRRGIALPAAAMGALFASGSPAEATDFARRAMESRAAAAAGWKLAAAWWPAAACLLAGLAGGWQFAPARAAAAAAATGPGPRSAASGLHPAMGVGPAAAGEFDLDSVINDLRRLEPEGNDPALPVHVSAALMDMPPAAVPRVLEVLRTRGWGDDTRMVAEGFFLRWATLDPPAAWKEVFAPDLLGASRPVVGTVFNALPPGNPELLVQMLNDLPTEDFPGTGFGGFGLITGQHIINRLAEQFKALPGEQAAPLILRLHYGQHRSYAVSGTRKQTTEDCAALAPAAESLPLAEMSGVMHFTEAWTRLDPDAAEAWIGTLRPRSGHWTQATISRARILASTDPAAAAQLITDLPWADHWSQKSIAEEWLKADPAKAKVWIAAHRSMPDYLRKELLNPSVIEEGDEAP